MAASCPRCGSDKVSNQPRVQKERYFRFNPWLVLLGIVGLISRKPLMLCAALVMWLLDNLLRGQNSQQSNAPHPDNKSEPAISSGYYCLDCHRSFKYL